MKLVIDIPEEVKRAFECAESNDLKGCYYDHGGVIGNAIKNATPLPDNATNGEIMKAIFPNAEITVGRVKGENITMVYLRNNNMIDASFYQDWWNAPYTTESEDKECR